MFARKSPTISDRRPPPPAIAVAPLGVCARCGAEVKPGDGMHGRSGARLQHFVCDPSVRDGVTRQIEAMRSLHRASAALRHVPVAKTMLDDELAVLPDVTDLGQVIDVLGRVRVAVECAPNLARDPRRLALSYLDALLRKL
jgi:hypothetical protein